MGTSNREKSHANIGCEVGRMFSVTQETGTHLCFWFVYERACYGLPVSNLFAPRKTLWASEKRVKIQGLWFSGWELCAVGSWVWAKSSGHERWKEIQQNASSSCSRDLLIWQHLPSLWAPAEPHIFVLGQLLPFPNLRRLFYLVAFVV